MTNTFELDNENQLEHHGVLGQKWGVRRYQRKDGSLTRAGQQRLKAGNTKTAKKVASLELDASVNRTIAAESRVNGRKRKADRYDKLARSQEKAADAIGKNLSKEKRNLTKSEMALKKARQYKRHANDTEAITDVGKYVIGSMLAISAGSALLGGPATFTAVTAGTSAIAGASTAAARARVKSARARANLMEGESYQARKNAHN